SSAFVLRRQRRHEVGGLLHPLPEVVVCLVSTGGYHDHALQRAAREVTLPCVRLLEGLLALRRTDAEDQLVFHDAAAHVASEQESEASEHLLLRHAFSSGQYLTDASGQLFTVRH